MNNHKNPRVVSLFSGCGGMDLGFKQAGFEIVFANDNYRTAQTVYMLNIGEIDGRDIRSIDAAEIPECDVLTAGFPCQAFSTAGKRQGIKDHRGRLYLECIRIIKAKRPKVVVFENVKGLLNAKAANGGSLAQAIADDLAELGYNVQMKLLDASDFGVPQTRQRLFFVGIHNDLRKSFVFPKKQPKDGLTLRTALDIPADVPNQVCGSLSEAKLNMVKYIPEGGSCRDVPYDKLLPRYQKMCDESKKGLRGYYRRHSRDEICGTITASAQPESCGVIHPTEHRMFSIREVARIQSFPDDFVFFDTNMSGMYKVIGNAVPVKLARAIGEAIMEQIFNA